MTLFCNLCVERPSCHKIFQYSNTSKLLRVSTFPGHRVYLVSLNQWWLITLLSLTVRPTLRQHSYTMYNCCSRPMYTETVTLYMHTKIVIVTNVDESISHMNKLCGRPARYGYAPAKAGKSTISSYLFARWHLFQHVGYLRTSATSWPLTFWPWKWCPSHVWRGLPLCQF